MSIKHVTDITLYKGLGIPEYRQNVPTECIWKSDHGNNLFVARFPTKYYSYDNSVFYFSNFMLLRTLHAENYILKGQKNLSNIYSLLYISHGYRSD